MREVAAAAKAGEKGSGASSECCNRQIRRSEVEAFDEASRMPERSGDAARGSLVEIDVGIYHRSRATR